MLRSIVQSFRCKKGAEGLSSRSTVGQEFAINISKQAQHKCCHTLRLFLEAKRRRLKVECIDSDHVEVELLFSGVCTMAAVIPAAWLE